ncbi:preprotein translocase subunit SecB [Roseburia inulinivorans]|uniref:Preprotein translocase subunit SecB n=1 Tax=Roseburia inulinivorans TaxID=360807 RepID=A0A3R6D978_9FIRM|nr:protein-export chaperone SecB [Roseburia inulinivorans]RHF83271.1 preprotein translocase subunit SecB [Roseburia inulinivorans]
MDINKIKSNLQMKNFYFSNCSFIRGAIVEDGEFNMNLQKEISSIGNHEYRVVLITSVEKEDMKLELIAQADFLYESDDYSREEAIINANTVAIMFPFIRSQVTLLTSQPGMTPIVLPAINTQKFK